MVAKKCLKKANRTLDNELDTYFELFDVDDFEFEDEEEEDDEVVESAIEHK
jgi:hypothetical protein